MNRNGTKKKEKNNIEGGKRRSNAPEIGTRIDRYECRCCDMERCQGGFCGPRVAAILATELSIPLEQVTKDGSGSNLVVGKTKSLVKEKLNI